MTNKVSMKQLFGLLNINYQEAANYLNLSKSTIEKRIQKNGGWDLSEVTMIVERIKSETGIVVDYKNIQA